MAEIPETPHKPQTAEDWLDDLYDHFRAKKPLFLQRVQQALNEFAADADLLLLAALASLLEEKPEQSLRYLKRFERRYIPEDTSCLLHALASAQLNRWGQAYRLIQELEQFYLGFPGYIGDFLYRARPWVERWKHRIEEEYWKGQVPPHTKPNRHSEAKGNKVPQGKPDSKRRKSTCQPESLPEAATNGLRPLESVNVEIPVNIVIPTIDSIIPDGGNECQASEWYSLRSDWMQLSLLEGFDELLCLPTLRNVQTFWFQQETVRRVLKQFRGRVLLADEVGLGKTIEAGMALKEYHLRGMANRILILTPASLVGQWREEMTSKFDMEFATSHDPLLRRDAASFWLQPRLISSLPTARRPDHAALLSRQVFDVVVVDEAHHLKNRTSQNWKLVNQLRKRFLLLLSATPVQNTLLELYSLLTLLKPGVFKTQSEFAKSYMIPGKPRHPANRERLRDLMRDTMIRNTRSVVDVCLPRRRATTLCLTPGDEESACYRELNRLVQERSRASSTQERLSLRHLLAAAGSSPAAAQIALDHFVIRHSSWEPWQALKNRYRAISRGCKEGALVDLLRASTGEKRIVFVHHRATLDRLSQLLIAEGMDHVRFEGGMSGSEKDHSIALFQQEIPLLLSTESGGEGRNLQFCNTLVNFDLPWNPMSIEQRIGRLHRIGQAREVLIFNFVVKETLEEYILKILDEKINMFELVVGEIGAILGELEDPQEFGDLVFDAWVQAETEERSTTFEALGHRIVRARRKYEGVKALDHDLFADEFSTQ